MQQKIIHISGFPGSGKTTLGESISKTFGKSVAVIDTDTFIQHNTSEGKLLLTIDNSATYKKTWRDILKQKIINFIDDNKDKSAIVFVGSLDNWAPTNTIYDPGTIITHKILLNTDLKELLKRYYLRIYLTEQKLLSEGKEALCKDYWRKLSEGKYHIKGSDEILTEHKKYNTWHHKHSYKLMTDKAILAAIKRML